jgi:hypothetical protein
MTSRSKAMPGGSDPQGSVKRIDSCFLQNIKNRKCFILIAVYLSVKKRLTFIINFSRNSLNGNSRHFSRNIYIYIYNLILKEIMHIYIYKNFRNSGDVQNPRLSGRYGRVRRFRKISR